MAQASQRVLVPAWTQAWPRASEQAWLLALELVLAPASGPASRLEVVSQAWAQGAPQASRLAFRLEPDARQVPVFPQAWQLEPDARQVPAFPQALRLEPDAQQVPGAPQA